MHIYAIKCGPYFKVGITESVQGRLKTLQCGNPKPMTVAFHMEVSRGAAYAAETAAHHALKACAHRDEWFRTTLATVRRAVITAVREMEARPEYRSVPEQPKAFAKPTPEVLAILATDSRFGVPLTSRPDYQPEPGAAVKGHHG